MYLKLGILGGIDMIKATLRRIQLIKDLFMIDLESGMNDIVIPSVLSLKKMPYSFRYYHFIMNYI